MKNIVTTVEKIEGLPKAIESKSLSLPKLQWHMSYNNQFSDKKEKAGVV